jgi:hypothetical protein
MESLGLNTSDPNISSPPKPEVELTSPVKVGSASKKPRVEAHAVVNPPVAEPTEIAKLIAGEPAGLDTNVDVMDLTSPSKLDKSSTAPLTAVVGKALSSLNISGNKATSSPNNTGNPANTFSPTSPLSSRNSRDVSPDPEEVYPLLHLSSGMIFEVQFFFRLPV